MEKAPLNPNPDSVWKKSRKRTPAEPSAEPEIAEPLSEIPEIPTTPPPFDRSFYHTPSNSPTAHEDEDPLNESAELLRKRDNEKARERLNRFGAVQPRPKRISIFRPYEPSTSSAVQPRAQTEPPVSFEPTRQAIPSAELAARGESLPPPVTSSEPTPSVPTDTFTSSNNPPLPLPRPTVMAQNPVPMPLSSDRHAPQFDPAQPRTLARYFQNLEALLGRAQIVTDAEKKSFAILYVPIDIADQWEALTDYADPSSYADWKASVYKLYPGADSTVKYTRQGLMEYVQQWKVRRFRTIGDWAEFYRNFRTQSAWLISQSKISVIDQNRWCADAIGDQTSLIATRLQVKHPDTHPGDGYSMADLDEAMRFLLQGTSTAISAPAVTPATLVPSSSSAGGNVKQEDVSRLLEVFQRLAASVTQTSSSSSTPGAVAPSRPTTPTNDNCHYCGTPGCRANTCPAAAEDLAAGKIRRNTEQKIILPGGSFVPRSLPGNCMRDRVNEWHRRNPGQTARGQLSYSVADDYDPSSSLMVEVLDGLSYNGRAASYVYEQDQEDRILALEREIYNLRRERFDGVEVPPVPARYKRRAATPGPAVRKPAPTASVEPSASESAPSASSAAPVTPAAASTPPKPSSTATQEPQHPLSNVRDATYLPPSSRNVAAPAKPSARDPAFRTQAPIENAETVARVLNRTLRESNITISPEELFAISPDLRSSMRTLITPKRSATFAPPPPPAAFYGEEEEVRLPRAEVLPDGDLPPGVYRIADPYEAYLRSLPPGEEPRPLKVAHESNSLRTVRALVAEREEVDCILDPGCQIVACSEAVCHELGFSYDPSVVLHMQSANGGVDRSLGLARNVPFAVGDMVFYLQVHVIREAAYDILLGRPFDVLASSIVRNYKNEDQTITLHCPNTGRCVTIPTLPRGRPRFRMPKQDF